MQVQTPQKTLINYKLRALHVMPLFISENEEFFCSCPTVILLVLSYRLYWYNAKWFVFFLGFLSLLGIHSQPVIGSVSWRREASFRSTTMATQLWHRIIELTRIMTAFRKLQNASEFNTFSAHVQYFLSACTCTHLYRCIHDQFHQFFLSQLGLNFG